MNTNTIGQELVELERRYWSAIQRKDVEGALALTDDPCLVAGASGVARLDHEQFRRMASATTCELHSFELNDVDVQLLTDDVAILAYRVHEDLTVDGKPVSLDASDSSTWVRRDGRWVCALHTEALTGDPYGRDRRGERDAAKTKPNARVAKSKAPPPEPADPHHAEVIKRVLRDPIPPGGPA